MQFRARRGALEASRRALVAQARAAVLDAQGRPAGLDLLVLPEMAATGYLFESPARARQVAEPAKGPTWEALGPVAREGGCWLVVGFPELAADRLFNSALVIDPGGGLVCCYRKTLLFEADWSWASPGDSGYAAFDTEGGRVGVGVCMDLNDDRFVQWAAGAGLQAIALPTNWLEERGKVDLWRYWAWRCAPASCGLVAANSWGQEGSIRFAGRSALLDAGGRVLASGPPRGDATVQARLPANAARRRVRPT